MTSFQSPQSRHLDLWLVAILLLAFALRVYRLGDQSLWFDEAFTWWTSAVVPPSDFVPFLLPYGAYTPTFYLMMRGVAAISTSEFVLRFPALIFGVLSIPAIEQVGRRVGGPMAGRVAALLLAINPFHVWWSQDARMYTMMAFFALVAMDGFMRAIDGKGWRRSIVASGAAYLTLYVTLFVGYIQLIWWLPRFRRQSELFRKWFLSHCVAVLPLVPWFILYLSQPVRGLAAVGWIPKPAFYAPVLTLWNFTSADIDTWSIPVSVVALSVVVVAVLGVRQRQRWRGLLLAWLIVPPLSALVLSLQVASYLDRYFAFSQFAWLIVLALGLTAMQNRRAAWSVGTLIAGLMMINTLRIHVDPAFAKEDWRGAATILNTQVRSGDRIGVQDTEGIVGLRYYYRGAEPLQAIDLPHQPNGLDRLGASAQRVWLVYRSNLESNHRLTKSLPFDVYTQTDPATQRWLAVNCRPSLGQWQLTGVTILLCQDR